MDSLVLKGVKIKAAAFTPPLSNPHPLERLQKTFWFLVTWVNWIMARIICPPTVCPQLVLVGKRNDGNIFLQCSRFQCLCGPSMRVLISGLQYGQYPNCDLYVRGKSHVFFVFLSSLSQNDSLIWKYNLGEGWFLSF